MKEYRCTDRNCGCITENALACPDCNGAVKPLHGERPKLTLPLAIVLGLITIITGIWWGLSSTQDKPQSPAVATDSTGRQTEDQWKGLLINFYNDIPCSPSVDFTNPELIDLHPGHFGKFRVSIGQDEIPLSLKSQTKLDFQPYSDQDVLAMTIEGQLQGSWVEYSNLNFDPKPCPRPQPLTPEEAEDLTLFLTEDMTGYLSGWTTKRPKTSRDTYELFLGADTIQFPNGAIMNGTNWQSYYQLAYRGISLSPIFQLDQFGTITHIQLQ